MEDYKKILKDLINSKLDTMTSPTIKDYNMIRTLVQFSIDMRLDTEFIKSIKDRFSEWITFDNNIKIKEI